MVDSVSKPTVVQVRIKESKTDPFRKGMMVYLGFTEDELCPEDRRCGGWLLRAWGRKEVSFLLGRMPENCSYQRKNMLRIPACPS